MSDRICICGHYKAIHHFFEYGFSVCTNSKRVTGLVATIGLTKKIESTIEEPCECKEYKLDNLRYLEGISRDKENTRNNKVN